MQVSGGRTLRMDWRFRRIGDVGEWWKDIKDGLEISR